LHKISTFAHHIFKFNIFMHPEHILPPKLQASSFAKSLLSLMQKENIPGLAVAVFGQQEITSHLEFGVKCTLTCSPVEMDTVFEGASLSKPVIAYAALKMCEDGLLELDKSLLSYLSGPYYNNPENLEKVTLHHVLTHTSGLPASHVKPQEPLTLQAAPGRQFLYSGESFCFLAHVMQTRISILLEDYIQKKVFRPLGMIDSSFIWQQRFCRQAALPHNQQGQVCGKWKPLKLVGSCSLHTTSADFAKFMMHVLENKTMLQSQIAFSRDLSWGFGFGLENTPQGHYFWHSGDNGTYRSLAIGHLESTSGFVVMTNGANGAKLFPLLIDHYLPGEHPLLGWEQFVTDEEFDPSFLANWWKVLQLGCRGHGL
jgi:CubicO group peptidase (beta-lactamase class C family)